MKHRLLYILAFLFATLQTFAQTYTYDNLNRLTKVVYDNGATVSYTYDVLGNRTSKKVTGVTSQTFTVTVAVTPEGSGTVTGGGTYAKGSNVELNAIANAGFEFVKWSDGETANPRTVIVNSDLSFTAQFKNVQSTMAGDITGDGKVNVQDLNALVDAYLANAQVTNVTDLDNDSQLTIADITKLISMIYSEPCAYDNNGHAYVDLGLPSGTLWATCNVGATTPEESGDFYAWGEIDTKEGYSWSTYKWCDGDKCDLSNQTLTKYCDRGGYGKMDGKMSLEPEDDVAHVKWGGDWHIPTQAEFQELIDNCTVEWIEISDGQHAFKITGANGKSILMPAAGEWSNTDFYSDEFNYWSAELASNRSKLAWTIEYLTKKSLKLSSTGRYKGFAVRPVLSEYKPIVHDIEAPSSYNGHDLVDLGLPSGTLWAKCNLGASSPEDYGCYYAWGESTGSCEGKTSFSNSTYKYYNGSSYTKYTCDGVIDLEPGDDAAKTSWEGEWRMPTYSEISELINTNYTTTEWTTENGVYGQRITSIVKGFEGKSIFLPAAGRYRPTLKDVGARGDYWASQLYIDGSDYSDYACFMTVNSSRVSKGSNTRYYGCSIRPVVSLSAIK